MSPALPTAQSERAARAQDGFVLIAVLWMLAALTTLASIYSVYAVNTATSSRAFEDGLQAEASIRAAVEVAALKQLSAPESARPSKGSFALRLGRTRVSVRYRSEAARIDLNAAPPELLAGLFATLGVEPKDAKTFADRIVGWRTKADPGAESKEAKLYAERRVAYPPRGGPFESALELSLLPGVPRAVVARALPFVTVFSGQPTVDITTAEPAVLSALPAVTPEIVDKVLKARAKGADGAALLALLGGARNNASADPPKAVRASIDVDFDGGGRVHAETVFRLKDHGEQPYDLLDWQDDLDSPVPSS